ncbi:hypothetical protein [Salinibacillus aidingensis]|uniref:hypothetical protein n=1 Tax=Salinibacillus aidingensis TaxID=237684 RepID=UPI0031D740FA
MKHHDMIDEMEKAYENQKQNFLKNLENLLKEYWETGKWVYDFSVKRGYQQIRFYEWKHLTPDVHVELHVHKESISSKIKL